MYSTEDAVTRFLKEHTGEPWQRISSLYLDFKLMTMALGRSHLCLVAPNIIGLPYAPGMGFPMYIPKNKDHIHHPKDFVHAHLTRDGRYILQDMPWVKIDLDNLRHLKKTYRTYNHSLNSIIEFKYELSINGDIKAKPAHSTNEYTIGTRSWQHLSWNVGHQFKHFYKTLKVDLDWMKQEISVGCSILGKLGTLSFIINDKGWLEAEMSPSIFYKKFIIGDLLFEHQLGFKVAGKVTIYKAPPPKPAVEVIAEEIYSINIITILIFHLGNRNLHKPSLKANTPAIAGATAGAAAAGWGITQGVETLSIGTAALL